MLRKIMKLLDPTLRRIHARMTEPPAPNLSGDRDIENSWIVSHLPSGPGSALDFGCGRGWLGLAAARKGFKVTAVDLLRVVWPYSHPQLHFVQGDLFDIDLEKHSFDLIINCSAIEHVGLTGRYNIEHPRNDGDLLAMERLKTLTKDGGVMIMTIPVGIDHVFAPMHRVYGNERLPRLLEKWTVGKKEFWKKNDQNRWMEVGERQALLVEPSAHYYGLGLFVLRSQ